MKKRLGAMLLIVTVILSVLIPVHGADIGVKNPYWGIDVSSWQKTIDWGAVKNSGVKFAMIRTGYGSENWDTQKDSYFEQNYSGAKNAGIKVGVYHYSYATTAAMASAEADFCLNILNGRSLDYPVAYDLEQEYLPVDTMAQIVQAFCSKIQQAGYKVMVYSSVNYYNNHLSSPTVAQYDTWIAHYTSASSPNFSDYTMWQYSSTASVPGVTGGCDVDYSYYDYSIPANTFRSDTSSYSFGTNSQYTYKIITDSTSAPIAVSSDPSAVSVSGATKVPDGFLFTITKNSNQSAAVTTTSADSTQYATLNVTPAFRSDTSAYTFGTNKQYTYKISTSGGVPTAVSSNPSVVSVSDPTAAAGGYLFTIYNVGSGDAEITTTDSDGNSVTFTATGTKVFNCDTSSYAFSSNQKYTYKITTFDTDIPSAQSSNSSAVSVSGATKVSDGYLFTIYNNGDGQADITTTSGDGTKSVVFSATGKKIFSSDTSSYTFGTNSKYIYKITTLDTAAPTAQSSDPDVVSVSAATQTAGGYLFTIYNNGTGSATITTTSSDGITTAFFPVTGTKSAVSLQCDTSSYTFTNNAKYVYKITTSDTAAPTATSSNSSAVSVSGAVKTTGGYLFTIYNNGTGTATITTTASDGTSVSFPATGSSSLAVQSDTPYYFGMKKGACYTFRFTGAAGYNYSFTCAGGTVINDVSQSKIGDSYYYKIYAVGSGSAGLYASTTGWSDRVAIVTVS
ncbi:MAG TPA: glycoside hydrolase family 25 protein [Caproicibacter sp.]|nr:glycoside hydrolase family 25 protein [Caproicibacter sp.]